MPMVDLIDETFLVVAPAAVAAVVADARRTQAWWPDLELTVFQDRGVAGIRWTVTGALVGTAEIWLEPFGDGTILHVFLRADRTVRGSATVVVTGPSARLARRSLRETRRRAWQIKRWSWALKAELEGDRPPGVDPPGRLPLPPPAQSADAGATGPVILDTPPPQPVGLDPLVRDPALLGSLVRDPLRPNSADQAPAEARLVSPHSPRGSEISS